MKRKLSRFTGLLVIIAMILSLTPASASDSPTPGFSDVPAGHWAEKSINELRLLNITNGIGDNRFGLGRRIKRDEFIKYLVMLMKWKLIAPDKGSFTDNADKGKWYYPYIETALANHAIFKNTAAIRPEDPITREDMAVMIVDALGYDALAKQLSVPGSAFADVTRNTGYITIAKDFGIINGVGSNKFNPYGTAKREEAAAMMMRMYERLNKPVDELHGFYAISSYSQVNMIKNLDSVSFGWSRLEYDAKSGRVILNTTRSNKNEYAVPSGFAEPISIAEQNGVSTQLMVTVKNDLIPGIDGGKDLYLLEYVLTDPEQRRQVIAAIIEQLNSTAQDGSGITYGGVTIDFEGLKGDRLKQAFNTFLSELNTELDKSSKRLIVAVHPKMKPGEPYFDGYDFKTIGDIADKVILMAHDYYAKALTDDEMQSGYSITPLTPIDEVYYALQAITDSTAGIKDKSKIWLQLSFDSALWMLKDGKVINRTPDDPSYDSIYRRLVTDVEMNYSVLSQSPNIKYFDSADGTDNVLWYENSQSIQAKIDLAKMFGINGLSLWRLGAVPDYVNPDGGKDIDLDVWQTIINNMK